MFFVDLILPLHLSNTYTYSVDNEFVNDLSVGKRVIVEFGAKKRYTAIIFKIHKNEPKDYKTKKIIDILDNEAIISPLQLKFWEWIAYYYLSTLGEVYNAGVPSALKLESETQIFLSKENIENLENINELNTKERALIEVLKNENNLSIKELAKKTNQKNIITKINHLLSKKFISVKEKLIETYKPKQDVYVKLTNQAKAKINTSDIFEQLSKSKKQLELLLIYLRDSKFSTQEETLEIKKKDLLEITKTSTTTFNQLIEKNIFEIYTKEVNRLIKIHSDKIQDFKKLSQAQNKALNEIKTQFEEKDVVLLHGVTSSGKTEIYIHLIQEQLDKGKQVLYLLPEIALTTQIINRLRLVFGDKVGVYHSKFANAERAEIWKNILIQKNDKNLKKYHIILGVRSAIFLPFSNLALIIIDEEHENTYKQYHPSPRYHARDSAVVLAKLHKGKVLMGTATPALETYFNVQNKKYGLVNLTERYQGIELPEILISDTHLAYKKKQMRGHHFTPTLLECMQEALSKNEQIILFQNRRGFSPYLECMTCNWIPKCQHCDVSLTYYQYENKLSCHYCGYTEEPPKLCKACGSTNLKNRGFGTEKIEEEIPLFFPDAKVARMDLNNTRTRKAYENLISRFENKKIDILIGTQMVSKGLDFDNVSLVGIMNADNLLNFADFRALERSFQLIAQVSGRAGRKNKRGKVVVQTTEPNHHILKNVIENDYLSMYKSELLQRKEFRYPPYYKLIKMTVKHKNINIVNKGADTLTKHLKSIFGNRILGPEFPAINRIQNFYLKNIILKIEKEKSISKTRFFIQEAINQVQTYDAYKRLQIVLDVDAF